MRRHYVLAPASCSCCLSRYGVTLGRLSSLLGPGSSGSMAAALAPRVVGVGTGRVELLG